MKKLLSYFSKGEWRLWIGSVIGIIVAYFLFSGGDGLTLLASLIGVTSLIFNAKGHLVGQVLMVVFSILYGIISYTFRYFGEMITYLGMTMPMAVLALFSWLRNPYKGNKAQVAVSRLTGREWAFGTVLTILVTIAFISFCWLFVPPICCPAPFPLPPVFWRLTSPINVAPGMRWPMRPTMWC